jgi:FAD/FMN-containing dehydrogenase
MTVMRLAAAAAFCFASIAPASATVMVDTRDAVTVSGGNTVVRVTADFAALGLTVSTLGSATIANGLVVFPITGGDLNPATLGGFILHNGSGVRFAAGATTLDARNFRIDTVTSRLFGDVTAGGSTLSNVALFDFTLSGLSAGQITNLNDPQIILRISSEAAGAFTSVFGAPNLAGAEFGRAATGPQLAAVPEPSTWALMIGGFGLVGFSLRRARQQDRLRVTIGAESRYNTAIAAQLG